GSGSIPPNKSDLKNFGVLTETNAAGSFLHLFWARVQDPSGTTNMDFEFNHNQCEYIGSSTTPTVQSLSSANGVTPVRSAGDLLLTYDLSNGGTTATIGMRTWLGAAWSGNVPLAGAVGTVNTSPIAAVDTGGIGPLSSRTFGEASIDLSTVFTTAACESLGSAYLKSRSSDAFSAALKDFIAPEAVSLSNCGSVDIHKQDDSGGLLPAGVNFKLYNDGGTLDGLPPHDSTEDTLTNPVLQCTTSVATGNCTIFSVPFGQYWVVETAPAPTGYTLADDQHVNLTRGTSATASLSFTDNRNPSALAIHKQDDLGNPLEGVAFTLWTDNAPVGGTAPHGAEDTANATLTCTTNAAGDCTISEINVPGHYWVVEGTPPTGYAAAADQAVNIVAGSDTTTNHLTFINARTFKVIVLVCQESNGTLYPSAVSISGHSVGNSLATAGTGLTESALCGITAGAAGGLSANAAGSSYPATAAIQP